MNNTIKLTQTVQKGGCAAKIAASELRKILDKVNFPPQDKNVIVDGGLFDDAAIYNIDENLSLVQTLDFFTPIVDSPRLFGKIAAANALSDVYAMGGSPKTAMAILAFPVGQFSNEVVVEVLQGASDLLKEAKVNLVGGHSIDDDTLKFGLSVTGYVHPKRVWSNAKAQENDVLILTKALGTGTATAGLKRQELSENDISEVIESMTQLNNVLDFIPESLHEDIHSATDITGFGLAGHAFQMAKASHKTFIFDFNQLPIFSISKDCLNRGFLTKAHRSNSIYTEKESKIEVGGEIPKLILFDPQTSGGLLLSVKSESAHEILKNIRQKFNSAAIVGRVSKPLDCPFVVGMQNL